MIFHRRPEKSQGNKGGLPAGKVLEYETDLQAISREIQEETGYKVRDGELELIEEACRNVMR